MFVFLFCYNRSAKKKDQFINIKLPRLTAIIILNLKQKIFTFLNKKKKIIKTILKNILIKFSANFFAKKNLSLVRLCHVALF